MTVLSTPSIVTSGLLSLGPPLVVWGSTAGGTTNWVGANVALFIPITLNRPVIAKRMVLTNGNTISGNVDAGIYTFDGTRIVSSGAIAHANSSGIQFLDITDTYLSPGKYYMALSCSSGTARIRRITMGIARQQMMGVLQASSAHVLPASVTFITPTTTQLPMFGFEALGVT